MAFNPIVQIIGLGALASMSACTGGKKTGEGQPEPVVSPKTETVVTTTETNTTAESRFSKECVKEYDTSAPCDLDGMVCPPPESMKEGICPPPRDYSCIEGTWMAGAMPTCNPPPVAPPPKPSK